MDVSDEDLFGQQVQRDNAVPPKITVEVWTRGEGVEFPPEEYVASVADVVRINDTWHVVVILDD